MTFKNFNEALQMQFEEMQQTQKLFRLNISGEAIWDAYLSGFTPDEDPIFRDPASSTHMCRDDKNFIRRYGNVVAINSQNQIVSMFDFANVQAPYINAVTNVRNLIANAEVSDIFIETFESLKSLPYERNIKLTAKHYQLGKEKTLKKYTREEVEKYGRVNSDDIYTFHHFHVFLDKRFVDTTGKSIEALVGNAKADYDVFERGIREISQGTLELVVDLINQGSLLNSESHLIKVNEFLKLKIQYNKLPDDNKNNWAWLQRSNQYARFRNELIGTLCTELESGMDLNEACENWNRRVDPANYKKAKAPVTQAMKDSFLKFIADNGYTQSFDRRFATPVDINVSEIKHVNVDATKPAGPTGMFAAMQVAPVKSSPTKRNQFDGVETVSIEDFMNKLLPTAKGVEVFLENKFADNFVVLTTAKDLASKQIFKWSNNFSWTYNGNLTGKSQIKTAVKAAGGAVDGVLRFSIMWADGNGDNSDLDAHCITPKEHIYFSHKKCEFTLGQLDIDIRDPKTQTIGRVAVENITFPTMTRLSNGKYEFRVHQYSARNSQGFSAEIEFNGEIYSYEYNRSVYDKDTIQVAVVTVKDGVISIEHKLPETTASREIWSLKTSQFHKVNLACLSPNYWGENAVGNKHYMFMLAGCKPEHAMRSFHNENLIGALNDHRKVIEVGADMTKITPADTEECLAGLGFSSGVQETLIIKLNGTHERVVKIQF
jgi:hypothetical protein